MFARSRDWTALLPLRKTLSALHVQFCQTLTSISGIVIDIELADKRNIKEWGFFIDGKVQGYSVRPPKKQKHKKQAFWFTRKLHGILRNSGHLGLK